MSGGERASTAGCAAASTRQGTQMTIMIQTTLSLRDHGSRGVLLSMLSGGGQIALRTTPPTPGVLLCWPRANQVVQRRLIRDPTGLSARESNGGVRTYKESGVFSL